MKNTESLYAIAEIIRAFTPVVLIGTGGAIALNAMTLTNLSTDKLALIIGFAGTAVTGACAMHNPQMKDRNQPQTRVGHIDRVDIEQVEQVTEGDAEGGDRAEGENQGRGGGDTM